MSQRISTSKLGEVADFVMGQAPPSAETNTQGTGTPFVQVRNFGTPLPRIEEWTTKPLKMAAEGDVLVCIVGATVGKVNLGIEAAITRSIAAVRPRTDLLDQKYLYHWMSFNMLKLRAQSSGSAQGVISKEQLAALEIPLPPLDKQRRIVETLDDHLSRLDKALSELEHVDTQTLLLRRSILNEQLNPGSPVSKPGVERMTTLPEGWQIVALGDLVDVLDSKRVPLSAAERKHREGSVPYYGATGQVGTIDKHIFDEPLVLLGEDGVQFFDPYKPKAYKIVGPAWVNNHAHVLRPKSGVIEFGYLLHYLNAFDYQGYANGTTRLKLTQGAMNSIPVRLPAIDEQRRIVETLDESLSRLDSTRSFVAGQKASLQTLRRSLLNKAFNGELGIN